MTFDDNITEASLRTFGVQKSTVESYLSERGLKSVKQMLTSAIYLEDSVVTVCGIKIYGAPWYVTVDDKHTMQLLKRLSVCLEEAGVRLYNSHLSDIIKCYMLNRSLFIQVVAFVNLKVFYICFENYIELISNYS